MLFGIQFGASIRDPSVVVQALAQRGATLDVTDKNGFSPLDTALGLAGGWGFAGNVGVVQESTVALLKNLLGEPQ